MENLKKILTAFFAVTVFNISGATAQETIKFVRVTYGSVNNQGMRKQIRFGATTDPATFAAKCREIITAQNLESTSTINVKVGAEQIPLEQITSDHIRILADTTRVSLYLTLEPQGWMNCILTGLCLCRKA